MTVDDSVIYFCSIAPCVNVWELVAELDLIIDVGLEAGLLSSLA